MTAAEPAESSAEESSSEQTTHTRTEVFPRDGGKRRTTILMTPQADEDITELMRRSRQNVPGLVIADAVRLMRSFPPEFVAMMFSTMDTGGVEQIDRMCRAFMRSNI